jgi:hypothetical protein
MTNELEFRTIPAVDRAKYEKEGWHVRTILNNDPTLGIHSLLMVRTQEQGSQPTHRSLLASRYRQNPDTDAGTF